MLLTSLSVLAVQACTTNTDGTPTPRTGTGSADVTSEAPLSTLPPRPRELRLDGIDPCSLWSPQAIAELALDPEPVGGGPQVRATGERFCSHPAAGETPPLVGFHLALVPTKDATQAFGGDGAELIDVAGYPAYQETDDGVRPCTLAVSTAGGQYLEMRLDYGSSSGSGWLPVEQACRLTIKAATFAVQTLQTQR